MNPRAHHRRRSSVALLSLYLSLASVAAAGTSEPPASITHADRLAAIEALPVHPAPRVDLAAVAIEDREREAAGQAPRFALPHAVDITPATDGVWEQADRDMLVWRLRVISPGAVSLNFGFAEFDMPQGGRLSVYSSDLVQIVRPFTARDNAAHGELWTPVVLSDDAVIEVTLPADAQDALELKLTSINVGYRGFGEGIAPASGSCNVDVVCSEGDGWQNEIPSVAAISIGGSLYCSGFMVNNTAQDRTPYFMTARHCNISGSNAASLVVYWNYQTSSCGGPRDGQLNQFQTGAFYRSSYSPSDVTLVELDESPDPAWGVTFAGWDRSGADATSAVAIHQPSGDEKAISFENNPTTMTSYLGTASPGDGTHVRVADWDIGTTEPGSSGSPLFNQDHRVVGQLHGGYAACGNDSSDWYGRFDLSWTGGGTSSTRLQNWLDPLNTGQMALDTFVAGACDSNGTCDEGEDCRGCPSDCISAAINPVCGNGVCETADGENCNTCPADCNAETGGPPEVRFCCGSDVDCGDERCSGDGNTCSSTPAGLLYCCGDTICEGDEDDNNCAIDCQTSPVCGDALCDPGTGEDSCTCPSDCGSPPTSELGASCTDGFDNDCDGAADCADTECAGGAAPDDDADGRHYCQDCDDSNGSVWSAPGETGSLTVGADETVTWSPPLDPGAVSVSYDLLRSAAASDFTSASCVASKIAGTSASDPGLPAAGFVYFYLSRGVNDCPLDGNGSLGSGSDGGPRAGADCP